MKTTTKNLDCYTTPETTRLKRHLSANDRNYCDEPLTSTDETIKSDSHAKRTDVISHDMNVRRSPSHYYIKIYAKLRYRITLKLTSKMSDKLLIKHA